MVGNLQHMAPPRIQHAYPYVGKDCISLQSLADAVGERPVARRTLPPQQTLEIKQAFLECATTVLAQFSLPNLYGIRHSSLNSELGSFDTDPFHWGRGMYRRSDGDSPAHLSTSKWERSKTNVVPLRRCPLATSRMRRWNPHLATALTFCPILVFGVRKFNLEKRFLHTLELYLVSYEMHTR